MSNRIDFNMLMDEISLHRSNAQRRIKEYKSLDKPTLDDKLEYHKEIGAETILMVIQNWCNDFKFSSDEVKRFIEDE